MKFATILNPIGIIFFALLLSCSPKTTPAPAVIPEAELVISGGDRDEHGCIATAGYTWSKVREECIRTFEVGAVLTNAQDPAASTACHVVAGKDESKREIFLPEKPESIVLTGTKSQWSDAKKEYVLTEVKPGNFILQNVQGIIIYKSE